MRTKNIFRLALCVTAMLLAAGCSKEFKEVTSLSLQRCIQPINLGYRPIRTLGNVGIFSWAGPAVLLVSALLTAGYLLPVTANGFFPGVFYNYSKRRS